jgi:putative membrane protein
MRLLRGVRGVVVGVAVLVVLLPSAGLAAAAQANQQDQTFLRKAHQSNLAEIQAGRLAQRKAASASVRDMGARLVRDHTRLDSRLRPVADQLGVNLPDRPNAMQRQVAAQLAARSGAAFDRAWVAAMLVGHRQALADGQAELRSGSSDRVRSLARSAAPVIQGHLTMLQRIAGEVPGGVAAGTGGQQATRPLLASLAGWSLVAVGTALLGFAALVRRRRHRLG